MTTKQFDELRNELSIKCKNGMDFTLAASVIWLVIAYIWTLKFNAYDKDVLVFIAGGLLLPLAFLFSKLLKTEWMVNGNPLQSLGLWLNFAQLFYFPFLILTMIKIPDHFITVYAIITGAHLFPYAWFYKTSWYVIFAGIIVLSVLLIGLNAANSNMYVVAIVTSLLLFALTGCLYLSTSKKVKQHLPETNFINRWRTTLN